MAKLMEPEVVVRVRECDKDLVKEAVDGAKSKFQETFKGKTVTVSIDTEKYLAPPPSEKNGEEESDAW